MNKPIKISVFFHTDESSTMENVGMDFKLENCEIRQMYFFNIAAIVKFKEVETGKMYSAIHISGERFISPLSINDLLKLIEDNK